MNSRLDPSVPIESVTFAEILDLDHHGPDTYVGIAPKYPWGRLFGGQVLAQALRAALATVDPAFAPHSLHAYFIRGGTHTEPVRFEVERLRNGDSFAARSVVARQSSGAILHLSASFQIAEVAADVSPIPMPAAKPPETGKDMGWGNLVERRMVSRENGHVQMWVRMVETPPFTDLGLAACALAFLSDTLMSEPPRSLHPKQIRRSEQTKAFVGASLDHAMHFHRPSAPTEWILADSQTQTLVGSRGLTVGRLYSADGVHVATCSQEVLLRERTR
ncbi:MAG: acyl-CoA thioesterase II [Acidimicrobiales bacterium]|nr:acyl-CoA thioesterase II [Acidimicrobiales bacterium]